MIRKITLLFFLLVCEINFSQVGIGTTSPNSDAVLDVFSTKSGVLIPRIELIGTDNFVPMSNHVSGMIVYNTATSGSGQTAVMPGFYYNNGVQWVRLEPLTTALGDIKHSILTADHNGWYLLDGRNLTLLPASVQTKAAGIGFSANLPDANDRFLKGKSSSESLMSQGGNSTRVLTQANLPDVTFSGIANTSGNHTHDYEDKYHGTTETLNLVTGLLGILGGIVLNILNNDIASGVVSSHTSVSTMNGSHSHTATITTGGSGAALPVASHMVVNTFVYLGK